MTQATRSNLMSVDTTLAANIDATQDYIPVASTTNFSTSVVAEIESTNEVVSFDSITTNLVTYSEQFNNAAWTNTAMTITADSTTAPDGTTTADKIVPTTAATFHYLSQTPSPSGASTLSIYAKSSGYDWIKLFMGGSSVCSANFNISTGALGTTGGSSFSTSTITDVGDGWYRCTMTNNGAYSGTSGVYVTSAESNPPTSGLSEAGDGTSGGFLWGAQLEVATAATGYLPTTSASLSGLTNVTRGANGTTAASASSGDDIQQLPYALLNVNMPVRLKGLSVSSDGTGAGRLTLCDKVGTHLCDVDIPDTKIFDLTFDGGILFPNGIYIANSDNITAYTLYTSSYNSPNLTAGG